MGGEGGEAWGSQTLRLASMPVNGKCGTSTGARVHPGEARDGDIGHPCNLVVSVGVRWVDGMSDSVHANSKFTWVVWGHSSISRRHSSISRRHVLELLGDELAEDAGATEHGCLHEL